MNRNPIHGDDRVTPDVPALHIELLSGACGEYGTAWGGHGRRPICDPFTRLYALDSGTARLTFADGTSVALLPGRLYLIPGGRSVRYRCTTPMRLAWIHFRVEAIPRMDLFARWDPPRSCPCLPRTRRLVDDVLHAMGTPTPGAALTRAARLLDLLQPFLPSSWEHLLPPPGNRRRLAPALDALTAEPARAWRLHDLARLVHLHPTYFSNLFRETFGIPPLRYLMHLRMLQAGDLLLRTDRYISDIARECGFPDPLRFSRVFRRATGVCPRDYRRAGGTGTP